MIVRERPVGGRPTAAQIQENGRRTFTGARAAVTGRMANRGGPGALKRLVSAQPERVNGMIRGL
jgi:hypothetical protein